MPYYFLFNRVLCNKYGLLFYTYVKWRVNMFWVVVQVILYFLLAVTIIFGLYRIIKDKKSESLSKAAFIFAVILFILSILPTAKVYNQVEEYNRNQKAFEENREDIVLKAEQAFNSKGYKEAIDIISKALSNNPNDEILLGELEKYKAYEPVPLSTYDQLKNTTNGVAKQYTEINKYTEDKFGNKYTTSFALSSGSVSFAINQKFTKLEGTIACPKGTNFNFVPTLDSAQLMITGDNETPLFTSNKFEVDTEPESFSIDITGVRIITITWNCEGDNVWENWGNYATIFDGMFYK